MGGTEQSPQSGGGYTTDLVEVSIANAVVVVVDPWAKHECPGWEERAADNLLKFLLPALLAFRSVGVPIIYAPHDRAMHPAILPIEGELVIGGTLDSRAIARALKAAGTAHIIYMGYASNYCLLMRPIGVIDMWRQGFDIIVVRDASIAIETTETFSGKWSHQVMMDLIEASVGTTVSVEKVSRACKEARLAGACSRP